MGSIPRQISIKLHNQPRGKSIFFKLNSGDQQYKIPLITTIDFSIWRPEDMFDSRFCEEESSSFSFYVTYHISDDPNRIYNHTIASLRTFDDALKFLEQCRRAKTLHSIENNEIKPAPINEKIIDLLSCELMEQKKIEQLKQNYLKTKNPALKETIITLEAKQERRFSDYFAVQYILQQAPVIKELQSDSKKWEGILEKRQDLIAEEKEGLAKETIMFNQWARMKEEAEGLPEKSLTLKNYRAYMENNTHYLVCKKERIIFERKYFCDNPYIQNRMLSPEGKVLLDRESQQDDSCTLLHRPSML